MKTVKTPKGTELPLLALKGKDYLQVAHRLVWFNEVAKKFEIKTEFLLLTDDQSVAKATVIEKDTLGDILKMVTATKRETKKDFSDHTEKAETGAIGRALALMGYGTQFALADLDEGDRLADSPVVDPKPKAAPMKAPEAPKPATQAVSEPTQGKPKSTFRKPAPAPQASESGEGGWGIMRMSNNAQLGVQALAEAAPYGYPNYSGSVMGVFPSTSANLSTVNWTYQIRRVNNGYIMMFDNKEFVFKSIGELVLELDRLVLQQEELMKKVNENV